MDIHTATEQAYKNGYAKGYADGKSEVVIKIFKDIEHVLNTSIWANDLEIKSNMGLGFNSVAKRFAVRKKAFEDAKDYLLILKKKYTEEKR